MPTGILHESKGADVALTTDALTYDNIISLYFSVKPEYCANAVWLMNDETAMALRKLKDADGNYLWRSTDDTIKEKFVVLDQIGYLAFEFIDGKLVRSEAIKAITMTE